MTTSEEFEKLARNKAVNIYNDDQQGIIYSNLAIAAAIREQTEAFRNNGIKVR